MVLVPHVGGRGRRGNVGRHEGAIGVVDDEASIAAREEAREVVGGRDVEDADSRERGLV